jgi:hypothetical protein
MPELSRRYVVMALEPRRRSTRSLDGVFVLKPWKDPAALRALVAYRDNCYPELASDLTAWIALIEQGPVVRGGVGRRNEAHVRPASGARAARAKAVARATALQVDGEGPVAGRQARPVTGPSAWRRCWPRPTGPSSSPGPA